jgi:hypothetical protein
VDSGNRPERVALVATAVCFAIFLVRAELAVELRGVVWYSIVPYFVTVWLARRRVAQRARAMSAAPVMRLEPAIRSSMRLSGPIGNN